jgi:hypothetical protein
MLFVKLRQFPGRERRHVALETGKMPWQPSSAHGIAQKTLYDQAGFSDVTRLERWAPGADPGAACYREGVEFFVLEGRFADDEGTYPSGSWLRLPAGARHHPRSETGCTLYVKLGGFKYLRSSAGN